MNLSTNPAPASPFVTPVTVFGNIAFVSGQLPRLNGEIQCFGRVGDNVDQAAAQEAAALCAHACLAALDSALGSRTRIAQVLKLTGFVASAPDFTRQGQVIDAASRSWSRPSARPAPMHAVRSACNNSRTAPRSRSS